MSKQVKKLEDLKPPFSDKDLYDLGIKEIPYIVKPIIPDESLVLLNAESNVGKSTLLRQIALSVAYGSTDFCGFPILKHGKVIVLSSEDVPSTLSVYLNRLPRSVSKLFKGNVLYFNNPTTFLKDLGNLSEKEEIILVMVDAFGDVFDGKSSNSTEDVRHFYQKYQNLCNKHGYSVVFLHHNRKASYNHGASVNNSVGSQAIQAKPRVTIEISKMGKDNERILSYGKHNYISDRELRTRFKLKFQNMYYSFIEKFEHELHDQKIEKTKAVKDRIMFHFDEGTTTLRGIRQLLEKDGFKPGSGIGLDRISSVLKESGRMK